MERAILSVILTRRFLASQGGICGRGATLSCRNPLMSPYNFIQGHILKIECLIIDITAVRSPDRAERAILLVILAGRFFSHFRLYLWPGSYFMM